MSFVQKKLGSALAEPDPGGMAVSPGFVKSLCGSFSKCFLVKTVRKLFSGFPSLPSIRGKENKEF